MAKLELGKSTITEQMRCPACGAVQDALTQIREQGGREEVPVDGSVAICFSCAEVSKVESGALVEMDAKEWAVAMRDPVVRLACRVIKHARSVDR